MSPVPKPKVAKAKPKAAKAKEPKAGKVSVPSTPPAPPAARRAAAAPAVAAARAQPPARVRPVPDEDAAPAAEADVRAPAEVRARSTVHLAIGAVLLASIVVGLAVGGPLGLLVAILAGSVSSVVGLALLFTGWGLRHGAPWAHRFVPAAIKDRPDVVHFFWHDEACPGCGHAAGNVAFCGHCGHPIDAPPMGYLAMVGLSFRRVVLPQPVEPARSAAFHGLVPKDTSNTYLIVAIVAIVGGWLAVNQFASLSLPLVVAGVVVPPILVLLWLRLQDRYEREPLAFMLIAFGWGIFSGIVAIPINSLGLPAAIAGITEEIGKAAILVFFAAHPKMRREMNGPTDGLVYGACAGLGFAAMENFGYVLSIAQTGTLAEGFLIRSANVLGHMMYTGITGSFLGLVFLRRGTVSPRDLLAGFWPACLVHAANNSAQYLPGILFLVGIAVAFAVAAWWFFKSLGDGLRDEAAWGTQEREPGPPRRATRAKAT